MKSVFISSALTLALLVALAGTSVAQPLMEAAYPRLGVGAKIPSAEVFLALVSPDTILEGGVSPRSHSLQSLR